MDGTAAIVEAGPDMAYTSIDVAGGGVRMPATTETFTMRTLNRLRSSTLLLAALAGTAAGADSSLDGHPAVTQYLMNDAPFVVFGVTPTRLGAASTHLTLSFIATDPLQQVHVFPFVRRTPYDPARLQPHVPCGPRDAGSWDCRIPVAELLRKLQDGEGELGLRIEAHGDLRVRGEHSTVIVTLPVGSSRSTTAAASR